jgi:hypothetical protein
LSENYHYIFETNPPLIFSIDPEVQKYIKASINGVHVDGNGQCSLGYNINISSDAPIDIYNKSLNNGFQKNIYTNGTYNTGKILGTRYVANGSKIEPKSTPRKLSRQYEVLVTSEMSAAEKIKKAPYTPISIIADGAIGIGTMVLMPFIFPLLIGGK